MSAKSQRERNAEYIREVVAAWPPLTDEQRTKLAELLKPVRLGVADSKRGGK